MFTEYLKDTRVNAPAEFLLNHLVGSFAEAVQWWFDHIRNYTPEKIARYYLEVNIPIESQVSRLT